MKYSISEDKRRLLIHADEQDKQDIRGLIEEGGDWWNTHVENECLNSLIANSDLEWIRPEECGDLTDAPILGYRDEEGRATGERWGFMDYQVRFFTDDLLEKGVAVFVAP